MGSGAVQRPASQRVQELISTLNAEGYWPTPLSATSNPYIGDGSATPAPGDFAQAYVIAHEVGHHVQTLLGISQKVQQAGRGAGEAEVNQLSVRQELQADCFAGLWGNHANRERQVLEPGDLEEALTAASAIGDDRLQKQAQGHVVPDSCTHGSSEQRVRWFRKGFESGDLAACDTFAAGLL